MFFPSATRLLFQSLFTCTQRPYLYVLCLTGDDPPSYQSLFGQLKEAKSSSSGICDFISKLFVTPLVCLLGLGEHYRLHLTPSDATVQRQLPLHDFTNRIKTDSQSPHSVGPGNGCGYLFKYMVKFPQLIFSHGTCSSCDLRAMYLNRNCIDLSAAAVRLWISLARHQQFVVDGRCDVT